MSTMIEQSYDFQFMIDGKTVTHRVEVFIDVRKLAHLCGRDATGTKSGRVTLVDRAVIVNARPVDSAARAVV